LSFAFGDIGSLRSRQGDFLELVIGYYSVKFCHLLAKHCHQGPVAPRHQEKQRKKNYNKKPWCLRVLVANFFLVPAPLVCAFNSL
jgi:hypothetical protein